MLSLHVAFYALLTDQENNLWALSNPKKNAVKLEPICVNKPVKDVHRNIKIYDNEIGE